MGSPTTEACGVKMYDRKRSAVDVVNELSTCLIPVQSLSLILNFLFAENNFNACRLKSKPKATIYAQVQY